MSTSSTPAVPLWPETLAAIAAAADRANLENDVERWGFTVAFVNSTARMHADELDDVTREQALELAGVANAAERSWSDLHSDYRIEDPPRQRLTRRHLAERAIDELSDVSAIGSEHADQALERLPELRATLEELGRRLGAEGCR